MHKMTGGIAIEVVYSSRSMDLGTHYTRALAVAICPGDEMSSRPSQVRCYSTRDLIIGHDDILDVQFY
jgi:hypothetical protein